MMFLLALIDMVCFCLQMNIVSSMTASKGSKLSVKRIWDPDVKFYLLTKSNPLMEQRITCDNAESEESHFNSEHPTRIVIHGWQGSFKEESVTKIANAWLVRGSYNVITVDWSQARTVLYSTARRHVREAGIDVATMIKCLRRNYRMPMDTLYVIGFSLGAHVAGHAGKSVYGRKIHTIVGLDPAGPYFDLYDPENRLSATDAQYVEVVHTSGHFVGFKEPIGTSDFYVDGGMSQSGCSIALMNTCSHNRAPTYYAEAITKRNYGSIKCKNYNMAINRQCGPNFSNVRLGSSKNSVRAKGSYYVPIRSKSPYGMLKF